MLQLEKHLNELASGLEELQDRDLTHGHLGDANSFVQAEAIRKEFCDFLSDFLAAVRRHGEALPESILEPRLSDAVKTCGKFRELATLIDQLAAGNANDAAFPQQRAQHTNELKNMLAELRERLLSVSHELRIASAEQQMNASGLDEVTTDMRDRVSALEDLISKVQDVAVTKAVDSTTETFSELQKSHARREFWWFMAFIVCAATFIGTCIFVAKEGIELEGRWLGEIISSAIQRLLLITVPAVFMKICLNKYNLERHLRILYDHRETVLNSYSTFEAGLSDDDDTKQKLRLEIAKLIFTDPATGYAKIDGGSEVNINPVISAVEGLTTR